VEIAAELEHWLQRRLSPIAIYNHPNIAALARWLASSPSEPDGSAPVEPEPLPAENLNPQQLLQDVRQMTQKEMEAFILQELAKQQR
jgi:hypothetical protein